MRDGNQFLVARCNRQPSFLLAFGFKVTASISHAACSQGLLCRSVSLHCRCFLVYSTLLEKAQFADGVFMSSCDSHKKQRLFCETPGSRSGDRPLFRNMMPCILADGFQRFGGAGCAILLSIRWKRLVPPMRWCLSIHTQVVTLLKTVMTENRIKQLAFVVSVCNERYKSLNTT